MNTPTASAAPADISVEINGDQIIKILHAFSVIGRNFTRAQRVDHTAWKFLLDQEPCIRSLTELCKVGLKVDPPSVALDMLKQLVATPQSVGTLANESMICLGAIHSLSRVMISWTTLNAKEIIRLKREVETGAQKQPPETLKKFH